MPHTTAFYDWKSRVDTLFGALKPHHRSALAEYSFGMVLARCCGLTSVVAYLAGFLAAILYAARSETSSNSWNLSVMSEASESACVVPSLLRVSSMAALKAAKLG